MSNGKLWVVGVIRNGNGYPEIEIMSHGKTANAKFKQYRAALEMLGTTHYTIDSVGGGAVTTEDACYFYAPIPIQEENE